MLDDIDVYHHACWYMAVRHVFLNRISCLMDIEPLSTLINIEMYRVFNLLTCMHPAMAEVTTNGSSGEMVKAFWNEFLWNWECPIGKLTEN